MTILKCVTRLLSVQRDLFNLASGCILRFDIFFIYRLVQGCQSALFIEAICSWRLLFFFFNLFNFILGALGEGTRYPVTGVTDSYKLPCGCWELNPDSLGEQPELLTAEPSLQPQGCFLFRFVFLLLLF